MKQTMLLMTAILGLALIVSAGAQQGTEKTDHQGTWKLVSTKYGSAKEFSNFSENQQRLKMITATHFVWVQHRAGSGNVQTVAGGPYSLVGDTYTETIEFAGEGMSSYLGAKHSFKIKVEGDKFFLSGELADGLKIEEIWHRMK